MRRARTFKQRVLQALAELEIDAACRSSAIRAQGIRACIAAVEGLWESDESSDAVFVYRHNSAWLARSPKGNWYWSSNVLKAFGFRNVREARARGREAVLETCGQGTRYGVARRGTVFTHGGRAPALDNLLTAE